MNTTFATEKDKQMAKRCVECPGVVQGHPFDTYICV
jgi:hypothetical protein